MPNRHTHRTIGTVSGALVALLRARDEEPLDAILEAIGGAIGGRIGGQLPDWLEPAIHPWHRDVAHSMATGAAIAAAAFKGVAAWENLCRGHAERFKAKRQDADGLDALLCLFAEALCRVASGFASGLATGYLSHLVLDARTPRSIPLLGR